MFTLEDLEVALQRPITPEQEPYYQSLIDEITAYIESETGTAFSLHTNETVRYRADGRGVVELIGPVVSVATITPLIQSNYTYRYDGWYWTASQWDGLGEIDGLAPYEVVDVTYTFGYAADSVPEDIKSVALEAAVGQINGRGLDDLTEKKVGDITYRWGDISDTDFDAMGLRVLNAYRGVAKTWRL